MCSLPVFELVIIFMSYMGPEARESSEITETLTDQGSIVSPRHTLQNNIIQLGDQRSQIRRFAKERVMATLVENPLWSVDLLISLKDDKPATKKLALDIIQHIMDGDLVTTRFIGEIFEDDLLEILDEEHVYDTKLERTYWAKTKAVAFEILSKLDIRDTERLKRKATAAIFGSEEGRKERNYFVRASAVLALGAVLIQDGGELQLVMDSARDTYHEVVARSLGILEDHLEREELWRFSLELYEDAKFRSRLKILESLVRSGYDDISDFILESIIYIRERKDRNFGKEFKQIRSLMEHSGNAAIGHEFLDHWINWDVGESRQRSSFDPYTAPEQYIALVMIAENEEVEDFDFETIAARIWREGELEEVRINFLRAISSLKAKGGRTFATEQFTDQPSALVRDSAAVALASVIDLDTLHVVEGWIKESVLRLESGNLEIDSSRILIENICYALMKLPADYVFKYFSSEVFSLLDMHNWEALSPRGGRSSTPYHWFIVHLGRVWPQDDREILADKLDVMKRSKYSLRRLSFSYAAERALDAMRSRVLVKD
ncbi:MAG TPA: hypothetical protein ENI23_10240 [bacterium]|nr:hypothetical protein [bacterium]